MSKGASLAPQLISMERAVLPETTCQGLFNHIYRIFKNLFSFVDILRKYLYNYFVII